MFIEGKGKLYDIHEECENHKTCSKHKSKDKFSFCNELARGQQSYCKLNYKHVKLVPIWVRCGEE